MSKPDIALGCPPVDPDPILLEQMTMLAAASVAPGSSPWWQRVATKSGAVAIAGVMALSGAAYAARGELAPIVKSMTVGTVHHAARHHEVRHPSSPAPSVSVSAPVVVATPTAGATPTAAEHGRRPHGFHPKRGQGAGRAKQDDQGNGNGHAYGHGRRAKMDGSDANLNENGDNSQGAGQGKGRLTAPGHTKTGRHIGSQGNHYGWSQSQGQSQPQG